MSRVTSFQRSGLTFDVTDEGPEEGDVVVLLHGFPEDRTSWRRVAPLLHADGLRTLALDQRGYSPGARPEGRGQYRTGELAGDVLALLDAARLDRAHIVGHDWGGVVAWVLGGELPERVRSLTVLSTPHPRALLASLARSSQVVSSWYMGFFQLPRAPEMLLSRRLQHSLEGTDLPEQDAAHYAARMAEPGALTAALNWYRAMPASLRHAVPNTRVPTTYAWGRRDFALRRSAAESTGRYVDAPYRFVVLDAGHWLPETAPERVADLVMDRVRSA